MDEEWIETEFLGRRMRLQVDVLRALLLAVTNRRIFERITGKSCQEQTEALHQSHEYKAKTRGDYYREQLAVCLAEIRKLRGKERDRMSHRISYLRGKIRQKEYQKEYHKRYRKTEKSRTWEREYKRQYRARKKAARAANSNGENGGNGENGVRGSRTSDARSPRKDMR